MENYEDIIELPHYRSPFRTPMPIENRAAQFAPFAALTGHDDAISETARLTDVRIELSNEEKLEISKKIQEAYADDKTVAITYFVPDKTKTGGTYTTTIARISKIIEADALLTLDTGAIIPICSIYEISNRV